MKAITAVSLFFLASLTCPDSIANPLRPTSNAVHKTGGNGLSLKARWAQRRAGRKAIRRLEKVPAYTAQIGYDVDVAFLSFPFVAVPAGVATAFVHHAVDASPHDAKITVGTFAFTEIAGWIGAATRLKSNATRKWLGVASADLVAAQGNPNQTSEIAEAIKTIRNSLNVGSKSAPVDEIKPHLTAEALDWAIRTARSPKQKAAIPVLSAARALLTTQQ